MTIDGKLFENFDQDLFLQTFHKFNKVVYLNNKNKEQILTNKFV